MSGPTDRATPADVASHATAAFRSGGPVRIGAEVEWLVFDRDDPDHVVSAALAASIASGPLPAGGAITIEPGGQVELVTQPAADAAELVAHVERDAQVLAQRFRAHGLALVPIGLDPIRPARRSLDVPRYAAMERYFAATTPVGIEMMNRTASLQLNVDFGADAAATWRWAHRIAPLIAATFANSPTTDGTEFCPVSHRQRVWAGTDPSRTRPVGPATADWHRYILDAHVMLHRVGDVTATAPGEPHRFKEWLSSADPPTREELELHLTTLFPPLRPRGYLELRMIDALPAEGRDAAIATVWTLLTADRDAPLRSQVEEICATLDRGDGGWKTVNDTGLADDTVRTGACRALDLVAAHLRSTQPQLADGCARWRARIDAQAYSATFDDLLAQAER